MMKLEVIKQSLEVTKEINTYFIGFDMILLDNKYSKYKYDNNNAVNEYKNIHIILKTYHYILNLLG